MKKLIYIGGVVIVALLGLWFGGSWYATKTAEDKLNAFVVKNDLKQFVRWEKVSATPLGSVTLKKVVVGPSSDIVINEVQVKKAKHTDSELNVVVDLQGIADRNGYAPKALLFTLMEKTATKQAAPANLAIDLNLDYVSGRGVVELDAMSSNLAQVTGGVKLQEVSVLKSLIQRAERGEINKNILVLLVEAEKIMQSVMFQQAELSVKDLGGLKRFIALQQRYLEMPVPGEDFEKTAGKQYQQRVNEEVEGCMQQSFIQKATQSCAKLGEFLKGDENSLDIKVTALTPLNLANLLRQLNGSQEGGIVVEID